MSTSTNARRRWTEENIETELRAQQVTLGHFPSRAELVAQSLRGLWDAATRMGGIDAWRVRLAGPDAPADRPTEITIHDQRDPRDRVAEAAYYRWLNGTGANEVENWLEAERELDDSERVGATR